MKTTNRLYLLHIRDAICQIEAYTSGVSQPMFENDTMRHDAVIRQLEIIGEASRHLSDDFQQEHSEIPWHAIIGMRNRIAHDYLNIDLKVVWEAVHHDLPTLKQFVEQQLQKSGG